MYIIDTYKSIETSVIIPKCPLKGVKMALHKVESRYWSMYSFLKLLTGLLFNYGPTFYKKGSMFVSCVQNWHLKTIQNFSHEP